MILPILFQSMGGVFAQDSDGGDLSCNKTVSACNTTPDHILLYLEVMNTILWYIEEVEPKWEPTKIESIIEETLGSKSNTTAFLNDVGETLFSYDGVFDDYRFLINTSSSLKRDKDKILQMYYKINNVTTLIERQLLKDKVDQALYAKIDVQLKRLKYIQLWGVWDSWSLSYNLERQEETFTTLIKLLWRINQAYAQLYKNKFLTTYFENLWTETYKSYTFPGDDTPDRLTQEKLSLISSWTDDFIFDMYINPFPEIRRNPSDSTQYVAIDRNVFIKQIRDLENEYRCTHSRQNVCDDGTLWLRKSFTDLNYDTIQNDLERSTQFILDKTSQLKWVFFSKDEKDKAAAKERKTTLLEGRYWAWWTPNNRPFGKTLLAIGEQFLEGSKQNIVDPVTDIWRWIAVGAKNFAWMFKRSNTDVSSVNQGTKWSSHDAENAFASDAAKEKAIEITANDDEDGRSTLSNKNNLWENQFRVLETKLNRVSDTFLKYTQDKQRERTTDMIYLDTKVMTKQAVWLSIYVHAAANRLWDYNTDPQSWIKTINETLTKMCEEQCTNLSDKKCREDQ